MLFIKISIKKSLIKLKLYLVIFKKININNETLNKNK